MQQPKMRLGEWGLLVTLSILWGGSFFFVKLALRELPSFTIVLSRVSLAAIALSLVVWLSGQSMPHSFKRWHLRLAWANQRFDSFFSDENLSLSLHSPDI